MSCRALLPLACFLAVGAFAAESAPPAAGPKPEPEKEKSEWVFSILPKSLQKNPLLELTVITEMTEAGKKLPPVSTQQPAFFEAVSGGFRQLGDAPGDEKSLSAEQIEKVLTRALAPNGYQPAHLPEHPPSLLIVYTWGGHYRKDDSDPAVSGNAVARNILDRASLVGGEKFAAELLRLFEQAEATGMSDPSSLPSSADSQAVITRELAEFANPVAMFRRASVKNEFLLDQTANDIYYVVASAYDYRLAVTEHRRVLLWRTRMTVASQGVSQEQTLPTLVTTAAPYFGKDMAESAILSKRVREGTVEVGTPVVVPPAPEHASGEKSGKRD